MIHDYLTRHPEVLIEMSQALRERQQAEASAKARQAIGANQAALTRNAADPVAGNPAGEVTIVEFFDVECPFCKKLAPDLARLVAENPGVRVVYKDYPILGPKSMMAARAALAAMRQGKYGPFHDALMADATPEHQLTDARVFEIAKTVGLDVPRLQADMAAPEIATQIAGNISLARAIGVTGTPALVIGSRVLSGAPPYEVLANSLKQ